MKWQRRFIGNIFDIRPRLFIIAITHLKKFYKNPSQKYLTNKCSYVIL